MVRKRGGRKRDISILAYSRSAEKKGKGGSSVTLWLLQEEERKGNDAFIITSGTAIREGEGERMPLLIGGLGLRKKEEIGADWLPSHFWFPGERGGKKKKRPFFGHDRGRGREKKKTGRDRTVEHNGEA